jgi:hypothetical protein
MPGSNYNAPQFGVKFELNRVGIARCTFNDSTDADNVGTITGIEGLESPEVRESGENLQEFDGGVHSSRFFYGRRVLTITGVIHGHASVAARNTNIQKLMDASNAMRDDAQLIWTPTGGQPVYMLMRRQQPLRVEGLGFNKTFTLTLVAADPRIYSTALHSQALTVSSVTNVGSTESFPTYIVTGTTTANSRLTINGNYVASFTNGLAPDYVYTIDSRLRTVQKGPRFGFQRNSFPNPSFEKTSAPQYLALGPNTTSFNAFAAMPSVSSGWGTHAASFIPNGTSFDLSGVELLNPDGSGYWPLPYLTPYVVGFSVLGDPVSLPPATSVLIRVRAYNAANTLIGTDDQALSPGNNTTWTRKVSNNTNLAFGSTKARIWVGVYNDSGTSGSPFYVDGIYLRFGSSVGGTFTPPGTGGWEWEGTANASSSIFVPSGTPTSAGPFVAAYDALDLTHTDWAGLPPGTSTVAVTNQGIGASASALWRDAWL